MLGVLGVPGIGHAPLVDSELVQLSASVDERGAKRTDLSSRLQDSQDLSVASLPVRRVAGSLDSAENDTSAALEGTRNADKLDGVEGVFSELLDEMHEIALDERNLVRETELLGVGVGLGDLVLVVVDADDFGVGEASDLTRRPSDTAADVEDFHIRLDADLGGEVVLVSGDRLVERFSFVVSTEMKLPRNEL